MKKKKINFCIRTHNNKPKIHCIYWMLIKSSRINFAMKCFSLGYFLCINGGNCTPYSSHEKEETFRSEFSVLFDIFFDEKGGFMGRGKVWNKVQHAQIDLLRRKTHTRYCTLINLTPDYKIIIFSSKNIPIFAFFVK